MYMCVCVFVCIYVYILVVIDESRLVQTAGLYMYIYVHICIYTHTYTCIFTYAYIRVCIETHGRTRCRHVPVLLTLGLSDHDRSIPVRFRGAHSDYSNGARFLIPRHANSSTKLAGAEERHLFACAMVGQSVYHPRPQRIAAILGALGPGVPLHIADTLPDTLELSSLSSPSPPVYFGQP